MKAVLWDAGGVIYSFDIAKLCKAFSKSSPTGKTPEQIKHLFFGNNTYNAGLAEGYYLGKINDRQFYALVKKALQLKLTFTEFAKIWQDIFLLNKDIATFIKKLHHQGIPQGVLTSTNPLHWEAMRKLFNVEKLFGKRNIICTFHQDAMRKKPDPLLFKLARKRLGVSSKQFLYVDDVKKYITAARALGIRGVHVNLSHSQPEVRCISQVRRILAESFK